MTYTKDRIIQQIEALDSQIEEKQKEISELKIKQDEWRTKLQRLEVYEKRPLFERTLATYIFSDTKSVDLMDKFEAVNEDGFRVYDRILVQNHFGVGYVEGEYLFGHLIIERLEGRQSAGDITMTDFKTGLTSELQDYVKDQVSQRLRKYGTLPDELMFDIPFLLRAQNSSNRTGYGSEYNGYDLVYQGTLYGETFKYAFVGVSMR